MPAFEIVVVGCGGGLDETNLSGYLLKPYSASWDEGIVALEAGSGHGALGHLLRHNPRLFGGRRAAAGGRDATTKTTTTPATVYANVKCFLLTHAHLDHISSLVVAAGSIGGGRKYIYAAPQTLKDLETVFSGRVWPRLASHDEDNPLLVYRALHADGRYKTVFPDVAVRSVAVSHGRTEAGGAYESSCFFVKHVPTQHEFIFFGDVEPDSVALAPRNVHVWRAAARKIPHDLSAIFIECSYPAGRPTDVLFGHLSPEHLAQEMVNLATEVVLARSGSSPKTRSGARPRKKQKRDTGPPEVVRGALAGLRVYIMHCKETFSSQRPMNHVIGDQCRELLKPYHLGLQVLTVEQGMKIVI